MESSKAAILVEQRQPLAIDEIEVPSSLGAGQVLVKLSFSGICGSQLGEIDGTKGGDPYVPHLLGHEGSGHVVEIGPGVRHVQPGDSVVLHWRRGAGIESEAPTYEWKGKTLNAGWVTTFNEMAIVSENRMTKIPASFDLDLAVLFGCPVTTGFGVVANDANITIGESILILGAGGVGLSIVQAASMRSAHPIIAVDRYSNRLALAKQLGASHTFDSLDDTQQGLPGIVGDFGVDVVVENTGHPDMIRFAYESTQAEGRTILVGVPNVKTPTSLHTLPLHLGKRLAGSHGGNAIPQEDIPRYIKLAQAGKLDLRPLITNRYHLEEINTAIADLREGRVAGRCLIEFG